MAASTNVRAPDVPVSPEFEAQVREIMQRPYRMTVQGEPVEGYLARVVEFPGCVSAGETPAEALEMLRDAMESWLIVALEQGDAIPEPLPMDYSRS